MNFPSRKTPEQLVRLGIVFGLLAVAVVLVRAYAVPDNMKRTGVNRLLSTEREMSRPVHFAGAAVCAGCHDAESAAKSQGKHRDLSCESCHGAAADHAEAPEEHKPYAPRDRTFCPTCHAYDPSRPTGFPQINPAAHNPLKPCISCHDPHAPVPPQAPHDCGACHTQISRTKAASAHAMLECTVCHQTPEAHLTDPRANRPGKPMSREFCGGCHGEESSDNVDAPKVDLATHGEKYLCWQCHYPHLPEGK